MDNTIKIVINCDCGNRVEGEYNREEATKLKLDSAVYRCGPCGASYYIPCGSIHEGNVNDGVFEYTSPPPQ
jgi:hypothetical protein